jgi:hypothetical protein
MVLIQIVYLKGISTGGLAEALVALVDKDAGELSAATVGRLKEGLMVGRTCALQQARSLGQAQLVLGGGIHVHSRLPARHSVCWSSSVPRPKARRRSSAYPMACATARNPGGSFSSTYTGADLRWRRS